MGRQKIGLNEFARLDIDDISSWYETISLSVRKRFSADLNNVFRRIQEFPESFPLVYKNFHKAILPSFPYSIIYRIKPDEIVVYAVIHMSRKPTSWLERIQ